MKRFRLFTYILLTIILLPTRVFSQNPEEVEAVAFGNPDGSPILVELDREIEIPVWLKCNDNIAYAHFCIATANEYVIDHPASYVVEPLSQWDILGTLPVNGWPSEGFTSQSIIGSSDSLSANPYYINTNGEWQMLGAFKIRTTDNPSVWGDQNPLYPGEDPVRGLTLLYDEFRNPIVPEITLSSLVFFNSYPPQIIVPPDDTLFRINDHYPFSFEVMAIDQDEENISMQVNFPYNDYSFTLIESQPGAISYSFSWTPPAGCDTLFQTEFIATDPNMISDTNTVIFDVNPVTAAATSDSVLAGYPASIEIWLTLDGPTTNVGSFDFLLVWDYNIATFTDAVFSETFDEWEYLNAAYYPSNPGSVKLIGVSRLFGGGAPPLRSGEYLIATVYFMTIYDPFLEGTVMPIEMPVDDFSGNVLSDSSGYLVYHPIITEGAIAFLEYRNYSIGDINHNSVVWETDDAILYANHLIDNRAYPFNSTQVIASDCNQDLMPETVADLVYLHNMISDSKSSLPKDAESGFAEMVLNIDDKASTISIKSESTVGGALVRISHYGATLDDIHVSSDMELHYNDTGNVLTAVIYNRNIDQPVNKNNILQFKVIDGNRSNIVIEYFEVSDVYGRLLLR